MIKKGFPQDDLNSNIEIHKSKNNIFYIKAKDLI